MRNNTWTVCSFAAGLTFLATPGIARQKERPNILWLTFEDTSANEFGCYGNKDLRTPNFDSLATNGIQYMNAWSVAPQSSPARSSLITGCYASTFGMDVHPVSHPTPADIFFPQRMREAGYYCTNNSKTHYNSTTDNKSCWDECTRTASYNSDKRGKDQPFFAVFNTVTSHMGRIRTFHTDGRRDYTQEGIYPQNLFLAPHVPDLPEVRSDLAGHLEAVQDVDTWVGFFMKDLKAKGLDDNTIVFVFSDHGGCLPRGKGFLYESGLRVPLAIHFPEKWRHLAPELQVKDSSLVNFTDLGPTVLSIAGVKPPKHMHGKALFGKYASKEKRTYQFALAANQHHHWMPVRAVTDGRFKYIRSYIPYRQFALRNYYQWGMPSNKAWDKFVLNGNNTNPIWAQPFEHHSAEMLFDLEKDPYEQTDLSANPEYAQELKRMGGALSEHIRQTSDLGFFLPSGRFESVLYDRVRQTKYPMDQLHRLAECAGNPAESDKLFILASLKSEFPEMRFWASVGCARMGQSGMMNECPAEILALMNDSDPYVAAEAAYAATYLGNEKEAIAFLVNGAKEEHRKMSYSVLECISLDKNKLPFIYAHLPELKIAAETLPRKQNEDAGLMARGILVNLGEMDIKDMHGPETYEEGIRLNRGRRKMVPLPY